MHTFPHKNLVLKCMNVQKVSTLTEVSPIQNPDLSSNLNQSLTDILGLGISKQTLQLTLKTHFTM